MKNIVWLIVYLSLFTFSGAQDMESLIENSVSEDNTEGFSFLNYLQNPIYIKRIKLHQLYEFPFLLEQTANEVFSWTKKHKYISAQSFREFLNNDELYEALRPFLSFEKNKYFIFSNQYLQNSYQTNSVKTKLFGKYKNHEFYLRNLNYKKYPDKHFWDYNWRNDFSEIRIGRYSIRTPLKLLSGSSSFNSRSNFHEDVVYASRPYFKTTSSYSQLSGVAAIFHKLNSQLTLFVNENQLALKTDSNKIIDFYSNPFLEIQEDEDSKYLTYKTLGISFWKKVSKNFSFNLWTNQQKTGKHKLENPDISPILYNSSYSYFNSSIAGIGAYNYFPRFQNEMEIISSQNNKYSFILKQAYKPSNTWIFEYSYYYYSPYIFNLQSRSFFGFDDIAYNCKGLSFKNTIKWYTNKSSHKIEIYTYNNKQIKPLDFQNWILIKRKFFTTYYLRIKKLLIRGKYKRYHYEENGKSERQHVLDFLLKRNLKGGSYVNFSCKTAYVSFPDHKLNLSAGSRFHYKMGNPLRFDLSWQLFHIKTNTFPFYEDELSYYPGIEWLRLTKNGFKLAMMLKWSAPNYTAGIKFRKIWKYDDHKLEPVNYVWFYLEFYTKY